MVSAHERPYSDFRAAAGNCLGVRKVLGRFAPLCKQCSFVRWWAQPIWILSKEPRYSVEATAAHSSELSALIHRSSLQRRAWNNLQETRLMDKENCPCSLVFSASKLWLNPTLSLRLWYNTPPPNENNRLNNNSPLDGRATATSKILTSAPSLITSSHFRFKDDGLHGHVQQMRMDLNWNSLIYNWSDAKLRFALQVVTDTAWTPTNLRRWGCREVDPLCVLSGRPCTLRHLLNARSSVL